jgi:hypothetical protein
MTTTNTYLSSSRPFGQVGKNNTVTITTTSTSTAELEVRVMVQTPNSGQHNMTKQEVLQGLEEMMMLIISGGGALLGEGGASNTVPLPLDAPTAGA